MVAERKYFYNFDFW